MGNLSWVTCQTRLPDLFVRSADCLWSWITSSGCSMAPGFAWPEDCSCKYTEDNSRILQDILNIWSRRILVALKEKTLNSTRNTPWSISFCLFMPWTWHHSQKNIFLSRVKRQGFSQENLYILGAPAHPFALRALHGSPLPWLPCIHSKPAESLAATGRGFLGLAKRKIE